MLNNGTTATKIREFLSTDTLAPFHIEGRDLSVRLVESGTQRVLQSSRWVDVPAYDVVFEGGKWGPQRLRCSVTPIETVLSNWEAYKAVHVQDLQRRMALAKVPAGTKYVSEPWAPKVGDFVLLRRGVSGIIKRLHKTRFPGVFTPKGSMLADVIHIFADGSIDIHKRVRTTKLSQLSQTQSPAAS